MEKRETTKFLNNSRHNLIMATLNNLLAKALSEISADQARNFELCGAIASGYPKLDYYTKGFSAGEVTVFTAMQKTYKTALILNISINVALDYKEHVLYISNDLKPEVLVKRLLFRVADISIEDCDSGLLCKFQLNRLDLAASIIQNAMLEFLYDMKLTLEKLEYAIKSSVKKNTKIVVLDYFQLLHDFVKTNISECDALSFAKELAVKYKVAIVVLYQDLHSARTLYELNKFTLDTKLFVQSGIDNVLYIKNQLCVELNEEENETETSLEIIAVKSKSGLTGSFKLPFDINTHRFHNGKNEFYNYIELTSHKVSTC